MLRRIEAEHALPVAVDHRLGRHHLRVEECVRREPAMEKPTVPVRPIHHRRDRQNPSAHHHPQLIGVACAALVRPGGI
jgi:hypothetical protein